MLWRAATIWPLGSVPYSQQANHDPGWRTDCSGYVSMCLDLAKPGLSTVTLTEGYIEPISQADLRPGDLVGCCGPGTGGDAGHVVLFDHWHQGHDTYWAYELHGPTGHRGPEHSLIHYPYHGLDGFRAYRYKEIADGSAGEPGGHV